MARINKRSSSKSHRPGEFIDSRDLSDQENQDPQAQGGEKTLRRPMASVASSQSRLPTPSSDISSTTQSRKRKRGRTPVVLTQTPPEEEGGEDEGDDDIKRFSRYYDPDQRQDERRQLTRESRTLERQFNDSRDEHLRDTRGNGLKETISRADRMFKDVRQTNDATLDSRLLVNVSDLAYKKSANLVLGDSSTGIDVDLFLSKCITFMQNNEYTTDDSGSQPVRSQQRRIQTQRDDEDDDGLVTNELDWAVLGQHACFPFNTRPPVPSFLLGPLSVQKKQRVLTQRRARQAKDNTSQEARPETLTREDLSQSDESALANLCRRIRDHLSSHIKRADDASNRAGFTQDEDINSDRVRAFFKKYRVSSTGGPSLFDYIINPDSFSQTVENMFYVSFLIKEGAVGVYPDADGLPTLLVSESRPVNTTRQSGVDKHQAFFTLDHAIWKDLIKAFDIRVPLIPHREDDRVTQIGSRGWYA